ncbi:LysR family transcriptional regulator [Demequina sp.]|uniref:LysR family transcriptional regulator n=1 Tax=Demequina sp. TaxID=2050685 RepID=UPI003A8785C8
MRTPDLDALRALTLVARHLSMSAAAEVLGVSQQAVSLRIRALERDLGIRLLARSARGSRLTEAGEKVAAEAAVLLAASDTFVDAVEHLSAQRTGLLRIGASLTIAEHLLPGWIAAWRALPHVESTAQVTAANSRTVTQDVRGGNLDLGFIESAVVPRGLGSLTVAHDTVEVVVQPRHPWARKGRVSVAELADTELILREKGSGTRRTFEAALAAAGHPLHAEPAATAATTLGVRSAVMAGSAPGVLSCLAVAADLAERRLVRVEVEGLGVDRPLTAIWAGARPNAQARAMLEAIARECAAKPPHPA